VVELAVDVFREGMVVVDGLFGSLLGVLVLLVWREGWRFMVWLLQYAVCSSYADLCFSPCKYVYFSSIRHQCR
jgi:hypothetical protein